MKMLLNEIDNLLARLEDYTHGQDGDDITRIRAMIAEESKRESDSGWIDARKTLPEQGEDVILCQRFSYGEANSFEGWLGDTGIYYNAANQELVNDGETATITHWKPLPEPPTNTNN